MRDRMERLLVLPFSLGCVSRSSVANQRTKPKSKEANPAPLVTRGGEENSSRVKMNSSWGFLALLKPNLSNGIYKLIASCKCFSQLFAYKEEMEEMEMKIGFPIDINHVTHIGWDGSTTTNLVKGWETLKTSEILSLPSISLRQFDLVMAAQADRPLSVGTSMFA